MREAIGGSQLLFIVITIIIVLMLLLAGSIGYTKAFKARNGIVNLVQEYGGYDISPSAILANSDFDQEVGKLLTDMGYKTSVGNRNCSCKESSVYSCEVDSSTNYNFCLYRYTDNETGNQYYTVKTFMYFELPVFGRNNMFAIPITGDTYTFFKYGL